MALIVSYHGYNHPTYRVDWTGTGVRQTWGMFGAIN